MRISFQINLPGWGVDKLRAHQHILRESGLSLLESLQKHFLTKTDSNSNTEYAKHIPYMQRLMNNEKYEKNNQYNQREPFR